MSDQEHTTAPKPRMRRPVPARTTPRRNILGVFSQNDGGSTRPSAPATATVSASSFTGAAPSGHPLGLPEDDGEDTGARITGDANHEYMIGAANVVDRNIKNGAQYTIKTDTKAWKSISSLTSGIEAKDVADLAKVLTQSYTEVAHVWVELAGKLRDLVSAQSGGKGAAAEPAVPAPMLCVQSARKVSARVQMFSAGAIQSVQPLAPEGIEGAAMITEVGFVDGQIDLFIPETALAGRYHGVILSSETAPIGVVTVTVPAPPGDAS